MTAESGVNSSEITNRCGRLRENSWRTSALIAMACGLTIWTRAWNFRDSSRVKKIAVRDVRAAFVLKLWACFAFLV